MTRPKKIISPKKYFSHKNIFIHPSLLSYGGICIVNADSVKQFNVNNFIPENSLFKEFRFRKSKETIVNIK